MVPSTVTYNYPFFPWAFPGLFHHSIGMAARTPSFALVSLELFSFGVKPSSQILLTLLYADLLLTCTLLSFRMFGSFSHEVPYFLNISSPFLLNRPGLADLMSIWTNECWWQLELTLSPPVSPGSWSMLLSMFLNHCFRLYFIQWIFFLNCQLKSF